jgi:hypothetical protein
MRHIWKSLVLAAVLLSPATIIRADDHDRRYYDRDHKDYHVWNEGEDRAWRHYLEERHEHYRAWEHAKHEQQREYWRWRHEHPDWH